MLENKIVLPKEWITESWKFRVLKKNPRWNSGKESVCQCRRCKTVGSMPGLGRSPGGENGQPIPVFLLGESHEQRSLEGYSPWSHRVGHNRAHPHKLQLPSIYKVQFCAYKIPDQRALRSTWSSVRFPISLEGSEVILHFCFLVGHLILVQWLRTGNSTDV